LVRLMSEEPSRRGDDQLTWEAPGEMLVQWQSIVDTMAEIINVPAALIMRLNGDRIKVCVSSRSAGNPYVVEEAEHVAGSGPYCERVIESGRCLLVPNAHEDLEWADNPDLPRGMVAYLGFPIRWPDLSPFGTICVLDDKANAFSILCERLVEQFRDVIEHHLRLITDDSDWERAAASGRAVPAAALASTGRRLQNMQAKLNRLQRQTTLNQFASAVVHEMNQPLAAIGSSAAAAVRWLDRDEPDVAAARNAVVRLSNAGQRAVEVMAGLSAMATSAAGEAVMLDLHVLVREVALLVREEATRARVNVQLRLSPDARRVRGNRAQLQLVLLNLIRNGIEAPEEADVRGREVVVRVRRIDLAYIEVSVDDNGVGIDLGAEERVFLTSFTTKATGMGLGLSICRTLVEAHGGTIRAGRGPGCFGASFTFTLPAVDDGHA
jgi:signal transduction histidine kinase